MEEKGEERGGEFAGVFGCGLMRFCLGDES